MRYKKFHQKNANRLKIIQTGIFLAKHLIENIKNYFTYNKNMINKNERSFHISLYRSKLRHFLVTKGHIFQKKTASKT